MSNYQRIVGTTSGRQHHPEDRIDPGREFDHIAKTPKVVGGLTKGDGELAARFYRAFIHEVELVSTPREAEMAKLSRCRGARRLGTLGLRRRQQGCERT